jgi:hypothetical protein
MLFVAITVTDEVDVEDLAVGASKSYDVTSYIGSGSSELVTQVLI